MSNYHTPVLLKEVTEGLDIKTDGLYIDGTIGGGGHAEEILRRGARVLGIDTDEEAILHLKKKFESEIEKGQLVLVQGNFSEIEKHAVEAGFEAVDGILLDLGVSSHQLDEATRGFSMRLEAPLDMRMDKSSNITARDIVNSWSEEELYEIFAKYGEEIKARAIAQEIVERRRQKRIETTTELAGIISGIVHGDGKTHPATRVFQALRIVVNDEINSLKIGLEQGFKLLKNGGRFEVISFHSLEDRAVKLYFLKLVLQNQAELVNRKPITAGFDETSGNRRSRSAKLRILNKK